MSEVAKVREALKTGAEQMWDGADYKITCAIAQALVLRGLKVCEEYEVKAAGHEDDPLHCVVCASKHRRLELVSDILRDAGLLEGR